MSYWVHLFMILKFYRDPFKDNTFNLDCTLQCTQITKLSEFAYNVIA